MKIFVWGYESFHLFYIEVEDLFEFCSVGERLLRLGGIKVASMFRKPW